LRQGLSLALKLKGPVAKSEFFIKLIKLKNKKLQINVHTQDSTSAFSKRYEIIQISTRLGNLAENVQELR
jgi:hypothetical protein